MHVILKFGDICSNVFFALEDPMTCLICKLVHSHHDSFSPSLCGQAARVNVRTHVHPHTHAPTHTLTYSAMYYTLLVGLYVLTGIIKTGIKLNLNKIAELYEIFPKLFRSQNGDFRTSICKYSEVHMPTLPF